ncbi:NLI interacting factor-like phosphatase [Plasmodium brasilianum]|uniref:NLI interacting factor-like phosphatase n=1 Tax=Plasmodium brasilianum TaxID=5824 RepID=A0ACB9Y1D7_PLABR|nr:NLI interacting factor-like phosphatase [Plasmodium brasilianum]
MGESYVHIHKNEGENILLKLSDDVLTDELEYALVPQYILPKDKKQRDGYCILKKKNFIINKREIKDIKRMKKGVDGKLGNNFSFSPDSYNNKYNSDINGIRNNINDNCNSNSNRNGNIHGNSNDNNYENSMSSSNCNSNYSITDNNYTTICNLKYFNSYLKNCKRNEKIASKFSQVNRNEKNERKKIIKMSCSSRSNYIFFNRLNKKKLKLAKGNNLPLSPVIKNIDERANNDMSCRKEIFVNQLSNSSKIIVNSAERIRILKKIFFKIKRKNEKLLRDKNFVESNLSRCLTDASTLHECDVTISKVGKEKEEIYKEKEISTNRTLAISGLAKLSKNRIYNGENNSILCQDAFKNIMIKHKKNNIKCYNGTKERKEQINLNKSINVNKKEYFKTNNKYANISIHSLKEFLKDKKKEYYEYGVVYEGKKNRGMKNFLFLNKEKARYIKPKENTTFNIIKKRNCSITRNNNFGKNKICASDDDAILEYCSSGISIKQSGITRITSIASASSYSGVLSTKGSSMNDVKGRENNINKDYFSCSVKKDINENFIMHKHPANGEKKKKIKNKCPISENDNKIFVDNEIYTKNGKEKILKNVSLGKQKKDANEQNEETTTEINKGFNIKCFQTSKNNKRYEIKRGNNSKSKNKVEVYLYDEEKGGRWVANHEGKKKDEYEDKLANFNVYRCKVGAKNNKNKVKSNIENNVVHPNNDRFDVKYTNYENDFDLFCKDVYKRIKIKRGSTFHYVYEKDREKNRKDIKINLAYSRYMKKKKKNGLADIYDEEKCTKKKMFFFEKNKLRLKNFIKNSELFNLSRKVNGIHLKKEKRYMRTKEDLGHLASYNFIKSDDSISKSEKLKMCRNENYVDKENLNKSSTEEKKNNKIKEIASTDTLGLKEEKGKKDKQIRKEENVFRDEKKIYSAKPFEDVEKNIEEKLKKTEDEQYESDRKQVNMCDIGSTNHLKKMNTSESCKDSAPYLEEASSEKQLSNENRSVKIQISNVNNSIKCDNETDDNIDGNDYLSSVKKKLEIDNMIWSLPNENNCNNYYYEKKEDLEDGIEGEFGKGFKREGAGENEDKVERKVEIIKKGTKELRSYFMKFKSFLFFENIKRSNSIITLNSENGLNKIIRNNKFHLKRKKKIKKLKSLSLLNIYNTTNILKNNTSEKMVNTKNKNSETCNSLLGEQKEKDKGRKTIVLDLDETLVHSTLKKDKHNSFKIQVELNEGNCSVYVNKRPGVDNFLKEISKYFEVVIFTASLPKYANAVIDKLDKNDVCAYRLFRESCTFLNNNFVKDLKMLGRDLNNVIIIDNSTFVHKFCEDNCILIKSWYDDPNDRELYKLIPFLKKLSKKKSVLSDLKKYNKKNKKKILKYL